MLKLQMILAMIQNASTIFYTIIFINVNITKRCAQDLINQVNFFAVARTHKFESISDIILEQPKLCPIIDQTGTLPTKPQKL